MSTIRILFLGTPDFAVAALDRMLRDEHYEIVGVVTQPDRPAGRKMQLQPSPVKVLAQARGLRVFTPESVNKPEFFEQIQPLGAECAVVVAFGQILSQKFIDQFPHGCVNVHGSVLPRWRGAAPIQRALMAGDSESGVSLQMVVRKLDAGDVLGIRRVPLTDDVDAVSLYNRLKELGGDLLHVELMDYLRGNLTGVPQDESQVTYAPKIDKNEARIDWQRPAREIFNQVRGLLLGPVCWTTRAGMNGAPAQALKIHKTRPRDGVAIEAAPGTVVEVTARAFAVSCGGHQVLDVLEVQPESRAKQSVSDYMRGYPVKVGDRFE